MCVSVAKGHISHENNVSIFTIKSKIATTECFSVLKALTSNAQKHKIVIFLEEVIEMSIKEMY